MEITNRKFFQEAQQLKTRPPSGRYGRTRAQERILFFFMLMKFIKDKQKPRQEIWLEKSLVDCCDPIPTVLGC